jgi:FixJ family two-component response regulator
MGTSDIPLTLHRGQVMDKMRAESLAAFVRMAVSLGLAATM